MSELASEPLQGRQGSAIVAVVTIVGQELDAARQVLGTNTNIVGTPYYVQQLLPNASYPVVVRKASDRGNVPANEAAAGVIEDFRPAFMLLVGIGGGILDKDGIPRDGAGLGDVVVADFIDYSEYRKLHAGRDLPRRTPHDHPSLYLREHIAVPRFDEGTWSQRIVVPRPKRDRGPIAVVGNIVAGEKVMGDPDSEYQRRVLEEFDKALVVETESMGFARAVFSARSSVHYNPQCLVIRGISDICNARDADNDETRKQWRDYAAQAAAALAAAIIDVVLQLPVQRRSATLSSKVAEWLSSVLH